MRGRFKRISRRVAMAAGAVWLGVFALLAVGQRELLYLPAGVPVAPQAVGLAGVDEFKLATPDGEQLTTWAKAAAPGKPTILYFHGNSGTLAFRANRFGKFLSEGWGLFAISYRSFNGSSGHPTEARNIADAKFAYDTLRGRGVAPSSIIAFGESLGTGVAVQVAADREVAGVVLDSPYTSIPDVAAELLPIFPVHLAVVDQYDTLAHIANIKAPLLIFHSVNDRVIPVAMGRRLAEIAPGRKHLVIDPDGQHVTAIERGGIADMKAWMSTEGVGATKVAARRDTAQR